MSGRRPQFRTHADIDEAVLMPNAHRWTTLLVAATCAVACSPTTNGQPESPPPTSSPSVAKLADGFPDMSGYAEADPGAYEVTGPPSSGASLLTPDGMSCWLDAGRSPEYASVSCSGPRPDKGPGDWEVDARRQQPGTVVPLPDPPTDLHPAPLPPMHVLHYEPDVFCGVDDKGTTACRVGDHGFVLTPTSTNLF
jgi:hypothetical protein